METDFNKYSTKELRDFKNEIMRILSKRHRDKLEEKKTIEAKKIVNAELEKIKLLNDEIAKIKILGMYYELEQILISLHNEYSHFPRYKIKKIIKNTKYYKFLKTGLSYYKLNSKMFRLMYYLWHELFG